MRPEAALLPQPRALCLAGPTASGKSAVAMALAQQLALEIISVDSALVYRGMDIGTAKPTAAERAAVPHHLIDILDPLDSYSAARFAADAQRLVTEIQGRGRLPLLVGGTMLYFKALREGLHAMPEADPAVRADIDRRAATHGWPALHQELARVDPATAARLAPADAQRIQRALEVWHVSGRPLSDWHRPAGVTTLAGEATAAAPAAPTAATAAAAAAAAAAVNWPLVSLEPASRGWLHDRIEKRFAAMLDAGFVAEVQALRRRGDLHPGLPSMRCVGYRQAWLGLDQGRSSGFEAAAIAATRQLAKRQLTWLRSIPARRVIVCDGSDALEQAVQTLRTCAQAH